MDIQVDITEKFDKEFKKLTQANQDRVREKMNVLIGQLQEGTKEICIGPRRLSFHKI